MLAGGGGRGLGLNPISSSRIKMESCFWHARGLESTTPAKRGVGAWGAAASTSTAQAKCTRTWVSRTLGHQTQARRFAGLGVAFPQIASFQPQPFNLNSNLFPLILKHVWNLVLSLAACLLIPKVTLYASFVECLRPTVFDANIQLAHLLYGKRFVFLDMRRPLNYTRSAAQFGGVAF